jgi:hypothetical protein
MIEAIMIVTITANCFINSLNTISEFSFATSCRKPVYTSILYGANSYSEFFPCHMKGFLAKPGPSQFGEIQVHHANLLGSEQRTEHVDAEVTL